MTFEIDDDETAEERFHRLATEAVDEQTNEILDLLEEIDRMHRVVEMNTDERATTDHCEDDEDGGRIELVTDPTPTISTEVAERAAEERAKLEEAVILRAVDDGREFVTVVEDSAGLRVTDEGHSASPTPQYCITDERPTRETVDAPTLRYYETGQWTLEGLRDRFTVRDDDLARAATLDCLDCVTIEPEAGVEEEDA